MGDKEKLSTDPPVLPTDTSNFEPSTSSQSSELISIPSLSSDLCSDTEKALLYTLVPGTHEDSISTVFPIIPNCGFCFMKDAFQVDKDKEACFFFFLSNGNASFAGPKISTNYFLGSELHVIAPKIKSSTNWLRFVLFLSVGKDSNCDERGCRINTMHLSPFRLSCQLNQGYGNRSIKLNFYAGVTDRFDKENMESRKNEETIIYHACIKKCDPDWCPKLNEFLEFKAGDKLPTIQIKEVKPLSDPSVSSMVYELPNYKKMFTFFILVSKDGTKHPAHKTVLCDRSPYFARELKAATVTLVTEMKVLEGFQATEQVLRYMYYPHKLLRPCETFNETFEILKLAHQFEMPDLMATAANRVMSEFDKATSSEFWNLYEFVHPLKNEMQINYVFWKTLIIKIKRLILESGGEDCDTAREKFLSLASFGDCEISLLEKLSMDLRKTREGESKEELVRHLKIQDLVTDFLLEVIKSPEDAE
ncbi:hypothetical protein Ocin01_02554 [Orchesella cincta]|uniref:BTB domain-containing protein n=1 Tax=Orchesella cincta TaxID=48709 RepID=A0A1D2NFZ0_ORCCI|nr:hypothetical protein Ocin01_02554 [Orchesella cincta]